jgi:hypothetical protein
MSATATTQSLASALGRLPGRITTSVTARLALAGTLAVAAAARYTLLNQPIWTDEAAAGRVYTLPTIHKVLVGVRIHRREPPGWYLLMWAFRRAGMTLGSTPGYLAVRWLSLLASLVAVAGVYCYARRLFGTSCALFAGVLTALGSQLVVYGGMARGYALFSALAIWYAVLLEDTLDSPVGWRLAALVVVVALGSYVHYFFLVIVSASIIYVWTASKTRRRRLEVTCAIALGLASLLPWLASLRRGQRAKTGAAGYEHRFSAHRVVDAPWNLFTGYLHVGRFVHDTQLAAFLLVCAGAVILFRRERGRLVVVAGVVPLLVSAVGTAAGLPLSDPRDLLGAAPFFAILASAPITLARGRVRVGAAVCGIALVSVAFVATQLPLARTSYAAVAQVLSHAHWRKDPPVVFFGHSKSTMKVVFSSLPQGFWMAPSLPPAKTCASVYSVIQDPAGQRWLGTVRSHVVRIDRVPYYGVAPEGEKRRSPVEVVQLARLPHDALASARAFGGNIFLRTPLPQVTKGGPPPAPYPACLP